MNANASIAVIGIGNPLCRDDGIGTYIIQQMRKSSKYPGIDLIDGGVNPDLLSLLENDIERLIIVDALRGGGIGGSIYRLEIRDENLSDDSLKSLHGLGILDSLLLMKKLDMRRPAVTIIGIEPSDTSYGLNLSPQIEALVPDIIKAIDNEISSTH